MKNKNAMEILLHFYHNEFNYKINIFVKLDFTLFKFKFKNRMKSCKENVYGKW